MSSGDRIMRPVGGKLVYIGAKGQSGRNRIFPTLARDYCDLLPRDFTADACDRQNLVAYV